VLSRECRVPMLETMTHVVGELKVGPSSTVSMCCPSGSHKIGGRGGLLLVLEMLVFIIQKKLMVSLVLLFAVYLQECGAWD
jgi:hypothetical protein